MLNVNILSGMENPTTRVLLNVSGCVYETYKCTLNRFPKTLLGDPRKRRRYYDHVRQSYFINRSHIAFEAILFYYQSNGRLVRPPFLPMELFEYECLFYELDEDAIRIMKEKEGYDSEKKIDYFDKYVHRMKPIWIFLEHPESSKLSGLFMFLSISLIFTTVVIDCLETIPHFFDSFKNLPVLKIVLDILFAVEFIFRFASCPSMFRFIIHISNIIDLFAVFPPLVIYFFKLAAFEEVLITRTLRLFRIFRMIRLSKKRFQTLSVVLHILYTSLTNLIMLIFCMLISITLFGSMIYYTEIDNPETPIVSVPEGMWLAMQTVVSVGYGDKIPVSIWGKIASALTAVIGALTMTLPLLSLGGKYFAIYTKTFDVLKTSFLGNKEHKAKY